MRDCRAPHRWVGGEGCEGLRPAGRRMASHGSSWAVRSGPWCHVKAAPWAAHMTRRSRTDGMAILHPQNCVEICCNLRSYTLSFDEYFVCGPRYARVLLLGGYSYCQNILFRNSGHTPHTAQDPGNQDSVSESVKVKCTQVLSINIR